MKLLVLLSMVVAAVNAGSFQRVFTSGSETASSGVSMSKFGSVGKGFAAFKEIGDDSSSPVIQGSDFGSSSDGGESSGGKTASGIPKYCRPECVEEGFLGPQNAAKIVSILRNPVGLYASMSTYHGYCKFAELLTGQKLGSKSDVEPFCLQTNFYNDANRIEGYNNGTDHESECDKSKMGLTATCKTRKSSPLNSNPNKVHPIGYSNVYSDDKANVLVVACFSDGDKVWILLTEKADAADSVDPQLKSDVLEQVKKLGLSTQDVVELNYNQCKA